MFPQTDCAAENRGSGKEIPRVHVPVTQEFEDIAVELIRARFGDDVDDRAWMQPIARRKSRSLHAKFLERIGKWERQIHVRKSVIIVPAIEQVVGSVRLPPATEMVTELG